MAQVRRRIDNVLITVPFSFTHQGIAGQVIIDDLGEGDRVYFKYGIDVDDTNDVIEHVNFISMADFYSLSLDAVDPEGVNPDLPLPELEVTRIPNLYVDDSDYKTFISGGTYDGETRIKLFITNNEENFPVEFSTFFHGSLSGTAGNYSPNTWATISRETDGSYYLILPSNDDTIPTPQPFWVRFVGNTVNRFGAYRTYRTNGDDPSGTIEAPGTIGTDDVVVRSGYPMGITVWGFFAGKDINRPNDAPASKTHYAEMSAMSGKDGSGNYKYRHQRPFYAYDIQPTQVGVPIWSSVAREHIIENRYADTDWDLDADGMKVCNDYLIKSGLQFWNFTYYANTYQGARFRNLFENLSLADKRGVKACYTIGQLGGDRNAYLIPHPVTGIPYPDLANDYTINLNYIVSKMAEPWYLKIDGKPVIFYFNSEADTIKDIQNLRAAYGGAMYEVYMTAGMDADMSLVNSQGLRAKTWYYQTNNNANGDHDLQSVTNDTYNNLVNMANAQIEANTDKDICPSFTLALDSRARNEYPGDTVSVHNAGSAYYASLNIAYNPDKFNGYYDPATNEEIADMINKALALKTAYGSRCKLAIFSTWDELSEGGKSCLCPKKSAAWNNNASFTIDDNVVVQFGNILRP